MYTFKKENTWRDDQSDFILRRKKRILRTKGARAIFLLLTALFLTLAVGPVYQSIKDFIVGLSTSSTIPLAQKAPAQWNMVQTRSLVKDLKFLNSTESLFIVDTPGDSYRIQTSLDTELMKYLNSVMGKLKIRNRGKPRQLAMVLMDANTGQIKAMAGYDLENHNSNPCTRPDFPAASIFKIVTATAAIDDLGYNPKTPLYFNGNKYTLYKRQLKKRRNKYTTRTTLERAFAQSVNPVFGKLGQNHLGRERLDRYAAAFGFNQMIPGDLGTNAGHFATNESKYHLAELGSGFNQDTVISPLFAATMVTAVLNGGRLLLPSMVDSIETAKDEKVYNRKTASYRTPMKSETAKTMQTLMRKTITLGTASKSFRRVRKHKILSQFTMGGKTGSLYNREHTIKYDWFAGFAKEKQGTTAVSIAVLVGHGKYIGSRATTLAQQALKQYLNTLTKK